MNTRRLFTRLLLLSLLLQAVPSASLSALAQAANPNNEQVLAATLTVNSTADPGDGICDSTECTLREAIASAAPGAVIDFSLALPATINLVREQLLIDKPLTINGPGRRSIEDQGGTIFTWRISSPAQQRQWHLHQGHDDERRNDQRTGWWYL